MKKQVDNVDMYYVILLKTHPKEDSLPKFNLKKSFIVFLL